MSRSDYQANKGAPITDKDARVIGKELEKIHEKNGYLTPVMVVDRASRKNSKLHRYFDWDDESAAKKHRLHYARMMMGWIVVVEYEASIEDAKPIRAFYNVNKEGEGRRYVTLEAVRSSEDYYQQVVQHAMKEAQGWAERYRAYSVLTPIVEVIDKIVEEKKAEDKQQAFTEKATT